jgi:hypothetical protein
MTTIRTVKSYPSDTPKCDLAFAIAVGVILIGVPVAFGCVTYVLGETAWKSMLTGAGCGAFAFYGIGISAGIRWYRTKRRLGIPLEPGERIEVVSGTLAGQRGTMDMHGQGGPGTLYVRMDSSPDDELIVFKWQQLRRIGTIAEELRPETHDQLEPRDD